MIHGNSIDNLKDISCNGLVQPGWKLFPGIFWDVLQELCHSIFDLLTCPWKHAISPCRKHQTWYCNESINQISAIWRGSGPSSRPTCPVTPWCPLCRLTNGLVRPWSMGLQRLRDCLGLRSSKHSWPRLDQWAVIAHMNINSFIYITAYKYLWFLRGIYIYIMWYPVHDVQDDEGIWGVHFALGRFPNVLPKHLRRTSPCFGCTMFHSILHGIHQAVQLQHLLLYNAKNPCTQIDPFTTLYIYIYKNHSCRHQIEHINIQGMNDPHQHFLSPPAPFYIRGCCP